jgi:hypothetical protein
MCADMGSYLCPTQLGGYGCFDGGWAWALSLAGYRFFLSPRAYVRALSAGAQDGDGEEGVLECACSVVNPVVVLEALHRRLVKARQFYEALAARLRDA